jgi:pimeloyl-ACP methyl ester carboxylesterase
MERGASNRPPADQILWDNPAIRSLCYASTAEALRPGTRGHAWETRLLVRPWGFRLEEIAIPVHVWHGDQDREAPPAMGRFVAERIPQGRLHLCPGEGHLLLFRHWEEILETLR